MAITINDVNTVQVRNAKNGDFDITLGDAPQAEPEDGVVQIQASVIQIRNAKNGDFDLILDTGGGWSVDDIATGAISGDLVITASTIRESAFRNCPNITSAVGNNVTTMGGSIFEGCSELASIQFQLIAETGGGAFSRTSLTAINSQTLPKLTWVASNAFSYCARLQSAVFPMVRTLASDSFRNCSQLRIVDIGALRTAGDGAGKIERSALQSDGNLTTLIMRMPVACDLRNINAFDGTPFASGGAGGEIYVPSALIDTYKSATNWSTLDGYGTVTWKAIEGSIYENAYADGTPIA